LLPRIPDFGVRGIFRVSTTPFTASPKRHGFGETLTYHRNIKSLSLRAQTRNQMRKRKAHPLQPEVAEGILTVARCFADRLPDGFADDLTAFLRSWPDSDEDSYKSPVPPSRSYSISELASLLGWSRGTIYKVLGELEIDPGTARDAAGKLPPEVVEQVIQYRKPSPASRNPHGRGGQQRGNTKINPFNPKH